MSEIPIQVPYPKAEGLLLRLALDGCHVMLPTFARRLFLSTLFANPQML